MALSGLPQKWLINYRVGLKQTEKRKRLRTRFITFCAFSVWEIIYLFVSRWPFTMSNFCILYISCPPLPQKFASLAFPIFLSRKTKNQKRKNPIGKWDHNGIFFGWCQRGVLVKTTTKKKHKNFDEKLEIKRHDSNVKMLVDGLFFFICSTRRILTH